jgi:membrane associated rhomboid family serine protease
VIVFALTEINAVYFGFPVSHYFALSNGGLSRGYVWQLLTFQFLHAGLWHLLFNLLALYFFGRMVEERLGKAAFLKVYFLSGVAGGMLQALLGLISPARFGMEVLGASAGVFGLITAATMLEPDSIILLFFILPLRARYFLYAIAAISLFYIVVPSGSPVAHGAHLGGILGAWAYMHYGPAVGELLARRRSRTLRSRPRELIKVNHGKPGWGRKPPAAEEIPPEEFISREVDPILDKISAHGIQSLTPTERKILEEARAKMEKR